MVIRELNLKSFGKFKNYKIRLYPGINLIYGENESGKSTIHTFIRGMLFGMEKQRGRASKNDSCRLCEPWDHPADYGGALKFDSGNKLFRVERIFSRYEKNVRLVCETDGEELSAEQGDLTVLLNGLTENAFRNTVSIGQLKSETDEGMALELRNYIANYYQTGYDGIDLSKVLSTLTEKLKKMEGKKKELNFERERCIQKILVKSEYVEKELNDRQRQLQECEDHRSNLEAMIRECKKQITYEKRKPESIPEKSSKQNSSSVISWILHLSSFCVLIGAVIGVFVSGDLSVRAAAGISGLAVIIALQCLRYYVRSVTNDRHLKKEQQVCPASEADLDGSRRPEARLSEMEEDLKKIDWEADRLRTEIKEIEIIIGNYENELEEFNSQTPELKELQIDIKAIELALSTVLEISKQIHQDIKSDLNGMISEISSGITGGKYSNIIMSDNMDIKINTENELLNLEQVSRGALEQIYFAVRLAVAGLFCKGEPMPIILDDTFAMYDEKRLINVLKWIAGQEFQVILFTCHKREGQLLDLLELPYHQISLDKT